LAKIPLALVTWRTKNQAAKLIYRGDWVGFAKNSGKILQENRERILLKWLGHNLPFHYYQVEYCKECQLGFIFSASFSQPK